MRVLVTGGHGQLGRDLETTARAAGDEVVAIDADELDITDADAVREAMTRLNPEVVVNCAAMTAVDDCESRAEAALAVNGTAVTWIARACTEVGARLVQISTDYVFDGDKPTPYVEDDVPHPRSVYGRTKLVGERAALDIGGLVVRTSWVCGFHGANMVKTVRRLVAEDRPMSFVDDQIGHPTFTSDLAPMIHRLAVDARTGIFHVTNEGAVSWYAFVCEIVRLMGHDPAVVRAIATSELTPPRPAQRPKNSVLANTALAAAGYAPMRDFREPLAELLQQLSLER